jgi:hypothetical protein
MTSISALSPKNPALHSQRPALDHGRESVRSSSGQSPNTPAHTHLHCPKILEIPPQLVICSTEADGGAVGGTKRRQRACKAKIQHPQQPSVLRCRAPTHLLSPSSGLL